MTMKSVTLADGSRALVDETTAAYLASTAPSPTQSALAALLTRVRSVQIMGEGAAGGEPIGRDVLLQTSDPAALAALGPCLRVIDGGAGHCMCYGDLAIVLLGDEGQRLAVIGVHHGVRVRWNAWRDDARLVDGESLMEWLAEHGVPHPLARYREDQRQHSLWEGRKDRWRAAMPACLVPFSDRVFGEEIAFDPSPLVPALERAFPEARVRALALFEWYGHGAGPWSEFGHYEEVPERILMAMPIASLVDALRADDLTEAQLEGAARFFAGEFRTKRKEDFERLTGYDRRKLFDQAMRSSNADNRARAEKAYGA